MPAAKFTPEQREEIARRYKAGETLDDLAAVYGVNKTTINNQLKMLGVPRRKFSPYTAKAIACPYSAERLREMYWKEGQSISDIGKHAATLMDRDAPVFQKTVTRWMEDAGITIRTLSEAQRVDKRKHRARYAAILSAIPNEVKKPKTTRPPTKQALKAAAQEKRSRCWETRPCSLPGCSGTSTRRKSEFNSAYAYCCHAHANSHQAALRREAKYMEKFAKEPTPLVIPDWLQEIIDRRNRES